MKDRIVEKLARLEKEMMKQLDSAQGSTPEIVTLVAMLEITLAHIVALEIAVEDLVHRPQPAPALDMTSN